MACYYSEYCFYDPSDKNIIDFLNPDQTSQIEGETLKQVQQRYPEAILIRSDDAVLWHEKSYKSDVQEINEDQYWDKLCCLPPLDHQVTASCETFKICEMLTGDITSIFCRISGRYFTFNDSAFLKHQEIRDLVTKSQVYNNTLG